MIAALVKPEPSIRRRLLQAIHLCRRKGLDTAATVTYCLLASQAGGRVIQFHEQDIVALLRAWQSAHGGLIWSNVFSWEKELRNRG
jgi:hypothetical protein